MNDSMVDCASPGFASAAANSTPHRSGYEHQSSSFHSSDGSGEAQRGGASRLRTVRAVASGLGHDLGNALMPIRLALESLATGELSPRALADLDCIRSSAEYLQNLANGLRMLSRDPLSPAPEGPTTELSRWWRGFEPLARALLKGRVAVADFATDRPMLVGLPPHRLAHAVFAVLQHLTSEDGQKADRVELWVDGLHDSHLVRICASEKRGHGKDGAEQGAQRGPLEHGDLAWVQEIVGEAGGRLDVEDARPGWGMTYALSLSLVEPAGQTSVRCGHRQRVFLNLPRSRQSAYVRCVLESLGVQVLELRESLSTDGLAVWITADAEEALRVARQGNFPKAPRVVLFGQPIADARGNMAVVGPQSDAVTVRKVLKNALRAEPQKGATL